MLTSGTSGVPKIVGHTLAGLSGAIVADTVAAGSPVWATFYDIRRQRRLADIAARHDRRRLQWCCRIRARRWSIGSPA